jgi:hypothetical protein
MVSCTPQGVPHWGHAKCSPRTCSSRSSRRFCSPSKRHSTTRHCCPRPSAAVKSSSGVMAATKLRIGFCAIASGESSKRLFLRKSDRHPLLNLEQRSRSKRNKWEGPCAVKGRPDPVGGGNLPGKSCSTRKQSEREGLATVLHEAFDAKGPARPDQRALRP